MTRKAMSIIGRIIGMILVVALAFGITWCATHWGTVQAEWDKIFNKTPQQEQPNEPTPDNPTPDNPPQEEINLDGYYVNKNLLERGDSSFSIMQIKGNKYIGFVAYLKNNDPSTIYFPQDYLEYIEAESALSLVYEETDEIISIGVPKYMEAYKDNEEYFNICKNYFVFDKQTKKMTRTLLGGPVEMIKIDTFEILPYAEPRLSIEDNTLHLTDMGIDGAYNIYYQNLNTGEEGAYVAGNVTEFDLTLLFNHNPKLVSSDEYIISVMFSTNDGFFIIGYKSVYWVAPSISEPGVYYNFDGYYYINVDGDITLVQIKGNTYRPINGYMSDSNIYFVDGWETKTEFDTFNTTEDEKYIHVYYFDESNGYNYKIAIYDKATSTLYYDFSNGEQFPGETYEDQLLFEMVKFTDYIVCNEHEWVEDLSYAPDAPTCGEYWNEHFICSKCHETKLETNGPLQHDYVDGVCSRCGETAITYQLNYDLGSLMEFVQTDPNGQYTTTEIAINFTSNGKSYSMIKFEYGTGGEPTTYMLYDSDIIYYVTSSNNIVWTDEAYRTITFETAPSGDLLAWLQANATPQA